MNRTLQIQSNSSTTGGLKVIVLVNGCQAGWSFRDKTDVRDGNKDRIGISFKINNLFDVDYQSVAYRPMPNRNYLIQINFKI